MGILNVEHLKRKELMIYDAVQMSETEEADQYYHFTLHLFKVARWKLRRPNIAASFTDEKMTRYLLRIFPPFFLLFLT